MSATQTDIDLLRFATAGSVDDGKSTLIGRLLHDSKSLFDDTLEAVAFSSARRGREGIDLSLVTDGLRAEREQGITIDVAYRYFATPKRSFIIADTPGHAQYTRNMVTGASNADLAVILLDAVNGLTDQTRRHAAVTALLGIRYVVLAVNKMDLVNWSEARFDELAGEFDVLAVRLGIAHVQPIPISALLGDNVVDRSLDGAWYEGPTLLEHLETVPVEAGEDIHGPFRFPVQYVIRPASSDAGRPTRHYAGTIARGSLSSGDEVVVLPAGIRTTVAGIDTHDGGHDHAHAGTAVTVRLAEDVDVARGDILVHPNALPTISREHRITLCWFATTPLSPGQQVLVKHTTSTVRGIIRSIEDRLDVTTLDRTQAPDRLSVNDLGTVTIATASPLAIDPYVEHRVMGSVILIDPVTNATIAAGMIQAAGNLPGQ